MPRNEQSEMDGEEFGERVEALAQKKGIRSRGSIQWFADQVGRTYSAVHGWINYDGSVPLYAVKTLKAMERAAELEAEVDVMAGSRQNDAVEFIIDLGKARKGIREAVGRLLHRMEHAEEVLRREVDMEKIPREKREKVEAETRRLSR